VSSLFYTNDPEYKHMRRRNFIQQGVFASSALLVPAALITEDDNKKKQADKPFN